MVSHQTSLRAIIISVALVSVDIAAAEYPVRPVRFVVPFSAGAGLDSIARLISPQLSASLGQRFVVDNRPSASGILGTQIAAEAAPDGYTIVIGNVGTQAANAAFIKNLPYDPGRDFTPVTQIARVTEIMLVHPSVPAKSVKQFIELAKARPGEVTFGTSGRGTTPHLCAFLFQSMTGTRLLHVSYKGIAPALRDLMSGQTNLVFSNIISGFPYVKSGRLRGLAVTSEKRSPVAPELPTIGETVPGYKEYNWYGIFVPARTPKEIVDILNREVVRALHSKEVGDRLTRSGAEIVGSTAEEFSRFVSAEREKYIKLVRSSGTRIE